MLNRNIRQSRVPVQKNCKCFNASIGFRTLFFKAKVTWWMEVHGLWLLSYRNKDRMHKDNARVPSVLGGSPRGMGIVSRLCSPAAGCLQLG